MRDRPRLTAALAALAALVYGASPIDIAPDLLLPFGIVDDAAVVVAAGVVIFRALRRAGVDRARPVDDDRGAGRRNDDDEIVVETLDD